MPPAIIAAAIGGGSMLGSTLLGRNTATDIARQQQEAASRSFDRSRPAFDSAYKYYQGLMSSDPGQFMGAIGPQVDSTNQQFTQAQKNLVGSAYARGGGLTVGLSNLEGARAQSLSQLIGSARPMGAAGLAGLASGDQNAGLSALAASQNSQTQNSMLNGQALGSIGSFITRFLTTPGLFSRGQTGAVNASNWNQPQNLPGAVIGNVTPNIGSPQFQMPYSYPGQPGGAEGVYRPGGGRFI